MTFDRWIELITLALAVVAGIYAAFMVVMKPFTDQLKEIARSMEHSSQRIERLFDSQNSMHEELIASKGEHQVINQRLDNVEDDVRELKSK
ncbi:hypothetical protein [Levilactobacillus spicheri]